ncbi:hypothetical protein [Paraflavitalea pollutisoli]|uniref:hypothetical protein n=1 Tax=Paraflavitalea pollutisoli TaxID=3034143 RepID=UPI0023EC2A4A|nr:hypothetical protein [Paraflavitalea sp. H1-2-19X]
MLTFLFPITHRQWLKNKEKGLENFASHVVTKTVKRINRQLSFLSKDHQSFITDGDVVNMTAKRNVYKNSLLKKALFLVVFVALLIAESSLNYENMEIFIMPGEEGIRAVSMRVFTALILTLGSIIAADLTLEVLFHHWLESDKEKFNFPDSTNISFSQKIGVGEKSRLLFLVLSALMLIGCLWAIFLFSQKRAEVMAQAAGLTVTGNGMLVSPITLVALLLPFLGGICMLLIKKNHNIVSAYRAMIRYRHIVEYDKKKKLNFIDVFSVRRARTLNKEIANSYRRVNRFRNYLEGLNTKMRSAEGKQERYNTSGLPHTTDQNQLKEFVKQRLEPETLRILENVENPLKTAV